MKTTSKTDQDFLWGVTSIGSQTEGGCTSSNWYAASCEGKVPEIGSANNYWEDYEEHHGYAQELGVGAVRISLEWARIEPEKGIYDQEALAHYRMILEDLHERGIKVMVGLFHWSLPQWCAEEGGVHGASCALYFERFTRVVCDALGDEIDFVLVLNEPMVLVGAGYVFGEHPPFEKRSLWRGWCAMRTMVRMHHAAYEIWHQSHPETPVGSTHLWNDVRWYKRNLWGYIFDVVTRWVRVEYMVARTVSKSDFLGINYYTANRYFFGRSGGRWGFHGTNEWHDPEVWRHFPEGLSRTLMRAAKHRLPIFICENGKPTHDVVDDKDRQIFLRACLEFVHDVRVQGVDVRGYFHYALMDSYEWSSGYEFLFGLVGVNRATLQKSKRKSFELYKEMIQQNETGCSI